MKKNFKEGKPNIFRFRNVYIFLSETSDNLSTFPV